LAISKSKLSEASQKIGRFIADVWYWTSVLGTEQQTLSPSHREFDFASSMVSDDYSEQNGHYPLHGSTSDSASRRSIVAAKAKWKSRAPRWLHREVVSSQLLT
jgi:hypothetical protein